MTNSPMSPDELAGWTAQQSARHERTFATTRAAHIHPRARCTHCGEPIAERVKSRSTR
jgi:hypothetical protein